MYFTELRGRGSQQQREANLENRGEKNVLLLNKPHLPWLHIALPLPWDDDPGAAYRGHCSTHPVVLFPGDLS